MIAALTAGIFGGILLDVLRELLGMGLGPRWLERTAQLVGAIGFTYMAVRGLVLWLGLFALGVLVLVVKWLWDLVVYFYST